MLIVVLVKPNSVFVRKVMIFIKWKFLFKLFKQIRVLRINLMSNYRSNRCTDVNLALNFINKIKINTAGRLACRYIAN